MAAGVWQVRGTVVLCRVTSDTCIIVRQDLNPLVDSSCFCCFIRYPPPVPPQPPRCTLESAIISVPSSLPFPSHLISSRTGVMKFWSGGLRMAMVNHGTTSYHTKSCLFPAWLLVCWTWPYATLTIATTLAVTSCTETCCFLLGWCVFVDNYFGWCSGWCSGRGLYMD